MRPGPRLWQWLDERIGIATLWRHGAKHKVPPETTSKLYGWLYVLGFVTLGVFVLQLLTGVALVTRYIPSTESAYQSVRILTEQGWSGRAIRAMHWWGASAMVVFLLLHTARVFLTGSYKYPREVTWLTGVLLLVLVIAMAFTGQLLRWDQDGLWGVVVASQYAGRVPLVGDLLKRLILAGDTVGGATLTRFFALHVIIMPLLILALVGVHLALVQFHGIAEKPRTDEPVTSAEYKRWYRDLLDREGRPFWPDAAWQELVAVAVVVAGILALAVFAGPRPIGAAPDPVAIPSHPRPDWFLMWYYALLAVKPRGFEDATMVYLPIAAFVVLVLLPFVRGVGERAISRRPAAVAVTVALTLGVGTLTLLGYKGPWVPDFETRPLSASELGPNPSDEAVGGAVVFHAEGCQYCHRVAGEGGSWGPDLTDARRRMGASTITDRILNGVGEMMPPYRQRLTAGELAAILAFLGAIAERGP